MYCTNDAFMSSLSHREVLLALQNNIPVKKKADLVGKRKNVCYVSHVIVHHKACDSHHGSSALVQFDSALASLPGVRLLIPSKVDEPVAEITLELSGGFYLSSSPRGLELILVGSFHGGPGSDHLGPNHAGEGFKGGKSRGNILASRESDASVSDQVSDNGKHGNTSVLELCVKTKKKMKKGRK